MTFPHPVAESEVRRAAALVRDYADYLTYDLRGKITAFIADAPRPDESGGVSEQDRTALDGVQDLIINRFNPDTQSMEKHVAYGFVKDGAVYFGEPQILEFNEISGLHDDAYDFNGDGEPDILGATSKTVDNENGVRQKTNAQSTFVYTELTGEYENYADVINDVNRDGLVDTYARGTFFHIPMVNPEVIAFLLND